MKMLIMGAAAVLLLGGGGAGAYFYFMTPAEASVPDGEEHAEVAKADKGHGDKKGHGGEHGESPYQFVQLDPLILPIVDENGVNQVVNMTVVLEVADQSAADRVNAMAPKLKDAYIQDMYGVLNRHAALKGGVIQVSQIKQRLNAISHHVLGEDQVNDVLLQVVQQRPI